MPSKKKEEELAFNRRYSRFKVQIFFKHRAAITHYGQERYGCTVAQIKYGHIKQVVFDRERGLQNCIDRIAICEKLYGPYQTALIYDRWKESVLKDGTKQKGKDIMKFVCGQLVEEDQNIFGPGEKRIVKDVFHFINDQGFQVYDFKKVISDTEQIDFKKEVSDALNKK